MKLSSQHRALYCYLILSVWIFLLVAGMYKYIGSEEPPTSAFKPTPNDVPTRSYQPNSAKPSAKMRRIYDACNAPESIALGSEGRAGTGLSLRAALVFLRHGDRGPLAHVRNISNVDCGGAALDSTEFRSFFAFAGNASRSLPPSFPGPFHGFPLSPPSDGECRLGQLTPIGVAQALRTGALLRQAYQPLNLNTSSPEDIVVLSTRYRRTFQSAVAFLYALLPWETLRRVSFREAPSLAFCFDACACAAAERLQRRLAAAAAEHLRWHPAVQALVSSAGAVAFEAPQDTSLGPGALRDAMLAFVCHGAPLPCSGTSCVRPGQLTGLFAYTEWEARREARRAERGAAARLRAYGALRDVVGHMLGAASAGRPRLVLYSGHDRSLQALGAALGLGAEAASPSFASRLVFELYKRGEAESGVARDYHFRVLYNGKDLTNRIHFCKGLDQTQAVEASTNGSTGGGARRPGSSTHLCPLEAIVRFLHDNYFQSFNATNFKDACAAHS